MLRKTSEHGKMGWCRKHEERQYIMLIKDILEHGSMEKGRNGRTLTIFGAAMHFTLFNKDDPENGFIPLLTTKKVAWKTCLKELLWFIKGDTNNESLQNVNVKIWNANASRQFLDSRGLEHRKENDLGPIYGHQWRFFNAEYTDCNADYTNKGVDQLQYIINNLKNPETRNSRRLVMTTWNPSQLNEMALPPCHILVQFNVVEGNKLSCALYQRSGDVGLGVPFNIASYCFLTYIIAKHCDLVAHEFIYYLGNAHIYDDHIESLKIQSDREPFKSFPTIRIKQQHKRIEEYCVADVEITGYQHHDAINMQMRK